MLTDAAKIERVPARIDVGSGNGAGELCLHDGMRGLAKLRQYFDKLDPMPIVGRNS